MITPGPGGVTVPIQLSPGAGEPAIEVYANPGDEYPLFSIDGSGELHWGGGGASPPDSSLIRTFAEQLTINNVAIASQQFRFGVSGGQYGSGFDISAVGSGFAAAEGANAMQGIATLVDGTVTVSNLNVTSTSRIILSAQDNNTTGALRVSARVAGTSFTITSSNAADSGVVAYEIFSPG